MHPLPINQAAARSALAVPAAVRSARVLMSAETPAVTSSGPIFDLAMSQGEEKLC